MINASLRVATVLLFALTADAARGQNDRVRTTKGSESGEITKMSAASLTLKRGSTTKVFEIPDIQSVQFGGEPSELTQARVNARNGGYQLALKKISPIPKGKQSNPYVEQELEFYKVYCRSKLALLGEGDLREAGRGLGAFVRENPQNFHFLQATELLGDLLSAAGAHSEAAKRYNILARAPWPSYKMRAGVLIGKSLQAQKKHSEALSRFDAVLAIGDDSPEGKRQILAARLGKAVSLSATGKNDQGVALVQSVLRDADPDQESLLASAYNALGNCYLLAGKEKDALFAFLHVDLLFANTPEAHAEALYHLGTLWEEIGKPQQAREARRTLQEQYAASRWAKQQ